MCLTISTIFDVSVFFCLSANGKNASFRASSVFSGVAAEVATSAVRYVCLLSKSSARLITDISSISSSASVAPLQASRAFR